MFSLTVKVRSSTVQGSRNHPRKNVKANIVRANIPVANGVVHLIDKPLIIVATPLWDYLRGEVSLPYTVVKDQVPEISMRFGFWNGRTELNGAEP